MRFEWDAEKNERNIRKHGIAFEDAVEVFDSPMLAWRDTRQDYGEERWLGIGTFRGRVVAIAFTERDNGETIRIISVRKASSHERQKYEDNVTN